MLKPIILIVFLFILSVNLKAQGELYESSTVKSNITATIIPSEDNKKDYFYFGTHISITVPGNVVLFLKGSPILGTSIMLHTISTFTYPGIYEASPAIAATVRAKQTSMTDFPGTIIHDTFSEWLNESTTGNKSPEGNLKSYTVGNKININETLDEQNDGTAFFDVTVNYN